MAEKLGASYIMAGHVHYVRPDERVNRRAFLKEPLQCRSRYAILELQKEQSPPYKGLAVR